MWREIVRRVDPDKAAEWFEMDEEAAIEAILAAGDEPGRPDRGHHPRRRSRPGPSGSRSRDPDVAFVEQVANARPFPPRSLPAPLEKTAAFIPTRRIEFYKEEDRFLELGETVPTYRPPFDDTVHDPATYPLALLSPHSKWRIHSSYANNAWLAEIHGGRPEVFISPRTPDARGIATGDLMRGRQHARRGRRLGPRHPGPAARQRHPVRGLVAAPVRGRQGRQRADLVRGQPHPRGPLRGQHVGPLAPAGRTAAARSGRWGRPDG